MAAAETGAVDSVRVLVKELGCNKDAQDKVTLQVLMHVCLGSHIHALLSVTNE